jgi:hypothetical protein
MGTFRGTQTEGSGELSRLIGLHSPDRSGNKVQMKLNKVPDWSKALMLAEPLAVAGDIATASNISLPRQQRWRPTREECWPRAKRAVDVFWQTIVVAVKMVVAIPLTVALFGSLWLLWIIVGLFV